MSAVPFGTGHINDSYLVVFETGESEMRFFLQRINTQIFTDPAALMDNIERVTSHISTVVQGAPDHDRRALRFIQSRDGRSFFFDAQGDCWRMTRFIDGARALETIESPQQAFRVAYAFGQFQDQLSSLPASSLTDTIPDFHNTPKRFAALEEAIETDAVNRAKYVGSEIAFARARKAVTTVLIDAMLPQRVVHNDTKSSNVLLDDRTGEGLCVVDLDTVMSGLAVYDFGDMVRSMTSPGAEDERDLSLVHAQFSVFEALARGYLASAGQMLNKREKQFLAFSGKLITLENGLRFLSDYLNGDTYYKVDRQDQNLDRCRAQFKLVESIERQEEQMNRLVETLM